MRWRFESSRRHNKDDFMKRYTTLILLLLAACGKHTEAELSIEQISLEVSYDNRAYELGESVPVTVAITAEDVSELYFNFSAGCIDGPATITVNEKPYSWDEVQPMNYEIVNDAYSKAVLHMLITPLAAETAVRDMKIEIRLATADNAYTSTQFTIQSVNSAPINIIKIIHPQTILTDETATIQLKAAKDHFDGTFELCPEVLEGKGFFIFNGKQYTYEDPLHVPAGVLTELEYRPLIPGNHKLRFSISDGICEIQDSIQISVDEKNLHK